MDEEVLTTLKERIDHALKSKNMKASERLNLEVMQLILVYMRTDHPRTERMWNTYVPMAWAMGVAMVAAIGIIVKIAFRQ
jgi:hypothetical protein